MYFVSFLCGDADDFKTRTYGTPEDLTKAFWDYGISRGLLGLLLLLLLFYYSIPYSILVYLLLMVPYLISAQVDISWFFQGLADFGRVVLKNTCVKLVSVVLILLWVKSPADLWKYLLIMSVSILAGPLSLV